MRGRAEGNLKWKLLALIGAVLLLVISVWLQIHQQEKRHKESKTSEETVTTEAGNNITKENETDKEAASTPAEAKTAISNLDIYAIPSMGQSAALLEQSLSQYVSEQQLAATGGTIVHVMVPDSDPESVYYYVQLDDPAGTICLLAYHPREDVVTASACSYSLEEVLAESWQSDAPAIRDVPPEEDIMYEEEQAREEGGSL